MLNSTIEFYANPSASHDLGEQSRAVIEQARSIIADSVEALRSEIIFTSGATESNNLVLKGVLLPLLQQGSRPHLITSVIEHKCIIAISQYLEILGCEVTYLKPDKNGIICASAVSNAIKDNTALVSIMHVNNELGTINPLKEIGSVCFENEILFHSDAAQSFQKVPIDVDSMNLDFLSLSAHKIGGPKGIGAAYLRNLRHIEIQPTIHGAGQESGIRGGTLATPLIESFGIATQSFNDHYVKLADLHLKDWFLRQLEKSKIPYVVNGSGEVLPSCLNITLPSTDIQGLIRSTSDRFSLSQGSACSAGSIEASHVLEALGISREVAEKTLRLSFPLYIEKSSLLELVSEIKNFTD